MATKLISYQDVSDTLFNDIEDRNMMGRPWMIKNILPMRIHLYVIREGRQIFIKAINANSTKNLGPTTLKNGDFLLSMYLSQGTLFNVTPSYKVFDRYRDIIIGNVVYDDVGSRGLSYSAMSHVDMYGVRLINHLSSNIKIYFNKNLVGRIAKTDGTGYMNGSPSTMYFDNNGNGLRLGDVVTIKIEMKLGGKNVDLDYISFVIRDQYTVNVHIGRTWHIDSSSMVMYDNQSYRVDTDNYLGITYYEPVTAYYTQPNNVCASF